MKLAQIASFVHKWLALIVGAQILLWIVTGFFFTLFPIEQVRSEHRLRALTQTTLQTNDLATIERVVGFLDPAAVKVTLETRPEGAVLLAEFIDARPQLFDARTGERLSPFDETAAARIARARIDTDGSIRRTRWVKTASPEYRGALPAWRVEFDDPEHLAVYVAADTGQVTARRSDLWRFYDALWALHIMDWRDHENFNHGLIIAVSAASLLGTIAGIVLIPYRFRWRRRPKPPTE